MLRLLHIEVQKLKSSRVFKWFIIAYFFILSSIAFLFAIEFNIGPFHIDLASQGFFNYPIIWHLNTFMAALIKVFLAIIIVTSVVGEYQYGTLKQNLIDGLSKEEFILSKVLTIIGFSIISCVFVLAVTLALGVKGDTATDVFVGIEYLGAYFLKLIAFLSLALFSAVLIKRSAFALFLIFILWIVESLGSIPALGVSNVAQHFPLSTMSGLIHEPFTRAEALTTAAEMAEAQGQTMIDTSYAVPVVNVIVSFLYFLFFSFGAYWLIKKRDL